MSTDAAQPFRIGLLGHGTVGGAFETLLGERADHVAAITGLRPEISGVLTRSRGDFEEILAGCELVVELIGGLEPARDYVLRAMRAGKHVVTANKQLLVPSRRGAVGGRARARRAAALRGVGRGRRAGHPRAAGVARRRARRPHPRDRQRHDELHPVGDGPHRLLLRRCAGRRPAPGLRRGRPDRRRQRQGRGREDGDPRAAGVRHARAHRPGHVRGHRAHHRRRHGVRRGARPRPEADRHRGAHRRQARGARAPGVPLPGPSAGQRAWAVQRDHRRVRGDHRDHDVRSGRGRPADRERGARRRHQRDDPARLDARDDAGAGDRRRRRVGVLPAHGGRRPPRRARRGRAHPGRRTARRSSRSCRRASASARAS